MLQSTHYELKLVEGSDIVNPLVIDRPNYEAIDGVMYENESKSIGNATELKSGTIHALTRTKGNQRFFCFTATSNYEAGDTFTVDSVPVTALLPNGTALPDNAYVVNGTVLCSLIGTLLTIYSVGSAIADDAIRFGGELPEYYAKASDLADVATTANAASTLSINNSNQISEINNNIPHRTLTVTGDGVKTNATLFTELFNLITNISNITNNAYIVREYTNNTQEKLLISAMGTTSINFRSLPRTRADNIAFNEIVIASTPSNSHYYASAINSNGATFNTYDNDIAPSGLKYTLYY